MHPPPAAHKAFSSPIPFISVNEIIIHSISQGVNLRVIPESPFPVSHTR